MLGEHEDEDFGSIDRPYDTVGVQRSGHYIPRSDPASEPMSLQRLDEAVGDGRVLRRVADEHVAARVCLVGRIVSHSGSFILRRNAL